MWCCYGEVLRGEGVVNGACYVLELLGEQAGLSSFSEFLIQSIIQLWVLFRGDGARLCVDAMSRSGRFCCQEVQFQCYRWLRLEVVKDLVPYRLRVTDVWVLLC